MTKLDRIMRYPISLALLAMLATPAFAHSGDIAGGFASGFTHPLFGADHVVAMIAVGLLGTFIGAPAIWMLPVIFPLVMAFGGVIGILGMPLPHVEAGIAISAIVLGAMVAMAAQPSLWIAAILVGAFAIFHGHAHGTELPEADNAVSFAIGFVVASGLLHLAGVGFGMLAQSPHGQLAVRAAGLGIALAGLVFLGDALT